MQSTVTVIGGANVDLSATLLDAFIAADSNPGKVDIGYGGVARNIAHNLVKLGKAGRKRHMGIRPTVRGSVMNPNDHPHGGGEGKTGIGRPGPSTPWGKPALGLKTRNKKKASNKLIVRRRDGKAIK